jgi:hypothetical protein
MFDGQSGSVLVAGKIIGIRTLYEVGIYFSATATKPTLLSIFHVCSGVNCVNVTIQCDAECLEL